MRLSSKQGVILSIVVLAGLMLSFVLMQRSADRARGLALSLEHLNASANRLDGLEWRVIHQGEISAEVHAEVERVVAEADTEIERLRAMQRHAPWIDQVVPSLETYVSAVRREMALVAAGEPEAAAEFDEATVDPSCEVLQQQLLDTGRRVTRHAEQWGTISVIGSALTLLLAIVAAVLLSTQLERGHRQAAAVRREKQALEETNAVLEAANAQLAEVSRMKSEFLANTSHELRTPLTGIMGFIGIVLEGLCDGPEEEREMLTHALRSSKNLLTLINDLLDLSKIEAGKMTLESQAVGIEDVFAQVRVAADLQAQEKRLSLVFEPVPDDARSVRGDAARIRQVLVNLVGNSVKFTTTGSVTVRATRHPNGTHAQFEVVDSGVGVAKDKLAVIFEPFTQADRSVTRTFGGTGIGLPISRRLVEMMGGVLDIESEGPGRGTRARFAIPLWDDAASADLERIGEVEGPEAAPLVLLVEDDAPFRRWASQWLQKQGYRTAEASSANQAWELIHTLRPDVVVLDYALRANSEPGLRTGWDLAARITEDVETHNMPLIFVTGFSAEVQHRLETWADSRRIEVLPKPLGGGELVAAIERALGGPQAMPRLLKVLLADDDPSVATLVQRFLPADRYELETVQDGEACLRRLRAPDAGVDIVLLDLMMPVMSGYDVLRVMAFGGVGAGIPVLVLTNVPEPATANEMQLLRLDSVVTVLAKAEVLTRPSALGEQLDSVARRRLGAWGAPQVQAVTT